MAHRLFRDVLLLAQELSRTSKGLTMVEMMAFSQRSRRSVERMLDTLIELDLNTETSQAEGEHHLLKRWRLTKPLPAPLVALDENERLALEGLAVTMPEGPARRAVVKLLASQMSQVATGVAVDAHTLIDRTAYAGFVGPRYVGSESVIGQCEHAIKGFEQINLSYRKDGEEDVRQRLVRPLGLLFGRFGYLVGMEKDRGVKIYRLNCIVALEFVGRTFKPPRWFNLKAWAAESFGVFHGDELKSYQIVFSPRVAERAASVQFHPNERKRRLMDGSLEVTLYCRGESELLHELQHPDWQGEVTIY